MTATFGEAVDVEGAPRLAIDMDPAHWGGKRAAYEGGFGTGALTFVHEVVEPNISTEGVAVLANTPELDSGAIRSAATELPHAGLSHDPAYKVDWRPEAASVIGVSVVSDAGGDGTYRLGDTIAIRVAFTEAEEVEGAPPSEAPSLQSSRRRWRSPLRHYFLASY